MRTALIVGAGIGGLSAGIALRQAGWVVRSFERAVSPRLASYFQEVEGGR
jgi:2-polyprenyl-6-methoxyphenol hydroxylase-like FAD-dependent oxidoreductase